MFYVDDDVASPNGFKIYEHESANEGAGCIAKRGGVF